MQTLHSKYCSLKRSEVPIARYLVEDAWHICSYENYLQGPIGITCSVSS